LAPETVGEHFFNQPPGNKPCAAFNSLVWSWIWRLYRRGHHFLESGVSISLPKGLGVALFAGRDYPGSYAELRAWFNEDWKCLDYLDWLRWPDGFVCPWCGSQDGWRAPDRRWRCAGCDRRVSATAGTIFHGTRTPLTVWFSAAWHLTGGKGGISATELRREMQLGSYQTAWAMLHRYRSVMVRPGPGPTHRRC